MRKNVREKKSITSHAGSEAATIDSAFPTGSKFGVIKESKKEVLKKFRGKQVLEVMKCRDYKERDFNLKKFARLIKKD